MNLNKMITAFGGPMVVGLLCCASPAHAETETETTRTTTTPNSTTETKTKKKVKANGDTETKVKTHTVTGPGTESTEGMREEKREEKREAAKREAKTETKTEARSEEMAEGTKRKVHTKRTAESDTKTTTDTKMADTKMADTRNTDTKTTGTKTTETKIDTTTKPLAADNTGKNDPDRSRVGEKPTADQAKNDKSDIQIMAQIRRDVMAEKGLSTSAHNVKIVAQSGVVTLKGPVKSNEEKALVVQKAVAVVGTKNVRNEIEIAP